MAQKIFIFIFLLFLVIFQISILPNFFPEGSVPDVVLIVALLWTAKMGFDKSWKIVALSGFLLDLFSFAPVGMNIFSFLVAAFAVSYMAKRFLVAHRTLQFFILAAFIAAGAAADDLARSFLVEILSRLGKIEDVPFFTYSSAYILLYDVVLLGLIYWPLKKVEIFLNFYGRRVELKSDVK